MKASETLPVQSALSSQYSTIGRDEMNLVEFPIALLSTRAQHGALSFRKERFLVLSNGTKLHQEWVVTGTPEYGLPQFCDEDVLIGLLKIGTDEGFTSSTIHFTRGNLLSVLGWSNDGRNHKRLESSLKRLATTKIHAKNSFWNNRAKAYETVLFGVIDSLKLYERSSGATNVSGTAWNSNWVRLSEEFYSSIQAGYIKPLDTYLYYSLDLAISRRLYRFLDKKRYKKERFEISLSQLASVHIGLSDTKCRFASWIKQQLDPSHEELKGAGFLQEASYVTARDGGWKVVYVFCKQKQLPQATKPPSPLVEALIQRGVSRDVADGLVACKAQALIEQQMEVFDYLNNPRVGTLKNPAGFLKKAIEEEWQLKPAGYKPRVHKSDTAKLEQPEVLVEDNAVLLQQLKPEEVAELKAEAKREAQAMIGHLIKLRDDSPVIASTLTELLRKRLQERGL